MGKLLGSLCYLAGPIDQASDDGVGWRKHVRIKCGHRGIKFIDPTDKRWGTREIGEEKKLVRSLLDQGKFKEVQQIVHPFRREDLRSVDVSDFLIAYIDPTIHMCGTYDEIFTAEREKKPRLAFINGGRKYGPTWIFDVFDVDDMFDSVDELIDRVIALDEGTYPMDDRWVLFRNYL